MTQVGFVLGARSKAYKPGYKTFDGWVPVNLPKNLQGNDETLLNIINNALAQQRHKAWDHERGGEMFHGAALVKTKSGNYFCSANVHLPNSPLTRNCAETNSVTAAVNKEGIDAEITDVWFMGGKGDLAKNIDIVPKDLGRRNSPCGSCLDVIWNNRSRTSIPGDVVPETHIHMLPLNDGKWHIIADDGRDPKELEYNQVLTRTIGQLFPHVTYFQPDKNGELKKTIRDGWEALNDPENLQAIDMALQSNALLHLRDMKNEKPEKILAKVNDLMIDAIRDLHAKSSSPLKKARVALVRLDNGEFYLGSSFENSITAGMLNSDVDAIQSAIRGRPTDHPITDIYVMAVNFEEMPELLEKMKQDSKMPVELKMPDGATRDRLSKTGPQRGEFHNLLGETINKNTGASVHIITLNNKIDFDPDKHVTSFALKELLPLRFISPKMDRSDPGAPLPAM